MKQICKEFCKEMLPILIILGVLTFLIIHLFNLFLTIKTEHKTEITFLKSKINHLTYQKDTLKDLYKIQSIILNGYRQANHFQARLTAYTARPEETNADFNNTSTMTKPVPGWTVAISRDLGRWKGKRIYIEGIGVRLVNDYMNERYKDKQIDILVHTPNEAYDFGVEKRNVYLIEPYLPFNKEVYCAGGV